MSRHSIPSKLFLEMGSWRQPLIMVDRIDDYKHGDKGYVKVIKHVCYNEPWMVGHFPDNPVMPGALISEIFGQASEYFSLLADICDFYRQNYDIEIHSLRDIYSKLNEQEMLSIIRSCRARVQGVLAAQNLKFKSVVYPGDTIEVTSKLTFTDPNGFHHYTVSANVENRVVSQGTIINFRQIKETINGHKHDGNA